MAVTLETRSALRIVWWCGLAGVLVDFDHFVSLLLWRYALPDLTEGRIWHTPFFIITCCLIFYLGTHIPGLYSKLVLGGLILATILVLVFSPEVIWRLN